MTLSLPHRGAPTAPPKDKNASPHDDAYIEDILSLQHNVIAAVQNLWGINERTKLALERRTAEDRRRREAITARLKENHDASTPYQQYYSQITREQRRLLDDTKDSKLRFDLRYIHELRQQAEKVVVNRWTEQGIWCESWKGVPKEAVWKHELPSKMIKRNAGRDFEKEASRPCYQFSYQVNKEREYLAKQSKKPGSTRQIPYSELSIKAYESVKRFWIAERIWRKEWTTMPGNKWLHEEALEKLVDEAIEEEKRQAANGAANEKNGKRDDETEFVWGGGF